LIFLKKVFICIFKLQTISRQLLLETCPDVFQRHAIASEGRLRGYQTELERAFPMLAPPPPPPSKSGAKPAVRKP
jgi:hypothetical protein